MITFKDVTVPALEGQYWVELNPLGLLKVRYGGDITNFIGWYAGAEAEQEVNIVCPLNERFRLLRFSYPYSNEEVSEDLGIGFKARTGDVFEIQDGMLVFAVVEGLSLNLYSDEPIPEFNGVGLISTVVQRGPGPKLNVLSRYERIINANAPEVPMIRSVGRVLLRQKVRNPLRISDVKGGIFSNIKSEGSCNR